MLCGFALVLSGFLKGGAGGIQTQRRVAETNAGHPGPPVRLVSLPRVWTGAFACVEIQISVDKGWRGGGMNGGWGGCERPKGCFCATN